MDCLRGKLRCLGRRGLSVRCCSLHNMSSGLGAPRPCCRGDNVVAIDLITEHIRMKLQQHDLRRIYPNLEAS